MICISNRKSQKHGINFKLTGPNAEAISCITVKKFAIKNEKYLVQNSSLSQSRILPEVNSQKGGIGCVRVQANIHVVTPYCELGCSNCKGWKMTRRNVQYIIMGAFTVAGIQTVTQTETNADTDKLTQSGSLCWRLSLYSRNTFTQIYATIFFVDLSEFRSLFHCSIPRPKKRQKKCVEKNCVQVFILYRDRYQTQTGFCVLVIGTFLIPFSDSVNASCVNAPLHALFTLTDSDTYPNLQKQMGFRHIFLPMLVLVDVKAQQEKFTNPLNRCF